ncbi:hypothetical protein INO15_13995 [Staphylococcus aureus]|nr:hypothetical protein [Staphylococcus aureus]
MATVAALNTVMTLTMRRRSNTITSIATIASILMMNESVVPQFSHVVGLA